MENAVSRADLNAVRSRVSVIDRVIRALINTSPLRSEILARLREDIEDIDDEFTKMRLLLPEQPGERDAIKASIKSEMTDLLKRLDE